MYFLLVFLYNEVPHGRGALIVHGVVRRAESSGRKILKNILVNPNIFRFSAAFHRADENRVAIVYIADTHVLGTFAGKYWEPVCEICC